MTVNRLVAFLTLAAFTFGGASMSVADDLVDTAVKAGTFKTLAAALGAADLVETLKGKGPFTVLAPSDDAFAKLPKGTVEDLLKPENKAKLKAILLAHVVPGSAMAADVVKLKEAKTAGGTIIKITVDGDVVKVGTAKGMAKLGVLTPMPCIPVTTPWTPGSLLVLVRKFPALDATSKCMCAYGGQISAVTTDVMVAVT